MRNFRNFGLPKKAGDVVRLAEARAIARERGGRLLSEHVKHCEAKVLWQCAKGHRWQAMAHSVKAGSWCAKCGKPTIEDMRRLAAKRGGKCLSRVYVNSQIHLQWQCAKRHMWRAKPNTVLYRWCPSCGKVRKLELNEIRRIARLKGGRLLSTKYVNGQTALLWRCANGHTWWAAPAAVKPGKHRPGTWCRRCYWLSCRGRQKDPVTLEDMQEIARQRGGECLSDDYANYVTKLKWRCVKGHEWMSTPAHLKQGHWCPVCARPQIEFEQVLETAARHGGKVLSSESEFEDSLSVLLWQCAAGHCWKDSTRRVRDGRWCPRCAANRPLTLQDMRDMARERGGKCLSKRYVNSRTPLRWRCARGHVWKRAPKQLRVHGYGRGHWCPVCAQAPKYSLEEMRAVARTRGGECLSKRVGNNTIPLLWRCARGHLWKAPLQRIINKGSWCKRCAHNRRKLTIEEMQALARANGCECLSKNYINSYAPLRWRCAKGHTFLRTALTAKKLNKRERGLAPWCPICAGRGLKARLPSATAD